MKKTSIAIVGLGGTGGAAFECLLRLGCENFILFDRDRFELTNFNRQLLATDASLDEEKINAAKARAKSINKDVKISAFRKFDPKKIKTAKTVIDGTDNVQTRVAIAAACRKLKIPYVFCSASFAMGMISVFTNQKFEKVFQLPKNKNKLAKYNTCTSVIAPATMFSGTLAASQAINYLIKKPFVRAPDVLFFDIFAKDVLWKKKLA